MVRPLLAAALLVATPVSAAKYDPDADRAALRGAANACYDETVHATGLALTPEKAAEIKTGLEEAVRRSRSASDAAKTLETEGGKRSAEMTAVAGGRGGPAPEAEAKDFAAAAAAQRARWTKAAAEQDGLKRRVDALPDKKDDGKPDLEKRELKERLGSAAGALDDADAALKRAEASAPAMADGAARLKTALKSSSGPAAERAAYDAQVVSGADAFPPAVGEAKTRVDMLGEEPREKSRARAWEKLDPLRDRARDILAAADRACNRADDFHNRSKDFDRAWSDFDAGRKSGAGAPAAAAAALDRAAQAQAAVKDRLDRSRP
ncbi:MAG: hypothetical protein HY079_10070 [Elusimicrobia bacterium]|nr:hypothetical protein [Elusimicrobiota bacterium]